MLEDASSSSKPHGLGRLWLWRKAGPAAVLTVAIVVVAACGGTSAKGANPSQGGSTASAPAHLTVAYAPNIDLQPQKIALDRGYFKAKSLNAQLMTFLSGPAQVSIMQNGQLNVGSLTIPNILSALSAGIKLEFLPVADTITGDPSTASLALIVSPTNGVSSMKGLEGKTIAAASLGSAQDFATMAMLAANGVDVSKVKLIALPYAQQLSALENGTVSGLISLEPYLSKALSAGMKPIGYPANYLPGHIWQVQFVLKSYADAHPQVIQSYVAAMRQAQDFANANPRQAQMLAADAGHIPATYSARIPTFVNTWSPSIIDQWVVLYRKFATLSGKIPPGQDLQWTG